MFADKGLSLVLVLMGVAFVAQAWRYGLGTLAFPGPGMVPCMLGIMLLALEAVDLGISLSRRGPDPTRPTGGQRALALEAIIRDRRTIFAMLTAGGFLLTYLVGLPAAIGAYAALSSRLLGFRPWGKNIVFGICLGVLMYYLFEVVFEVALPGGCLPDLIGR